MKDSTAKNADAASLTGDLLVRKGGATPAGFGLAMPQSNMDNSPVSQPDIAHGTGARLQEVKAATKSAKSKSKNAKKNRVRMTLRLDEDHHLRIRLTAAHLNLNLQEFILAAIDSHLEQAGPLVLDGSCACLRSTDHEKTS